MRSLYVPDMLKPRCLDNRDMKQCNASSNGTYPELFGVNLHLNSAHQYNDETIVI